MKHSTKGHLGFQREREKQSPDGCVAVTNALLGCIDGRIDLQQIKMHRSGLNQVRKTLQSQEIEKACRIASVHSYLDVVQKNCGKVGNS